MTMKSTPPGAIIGVTALLAAAIPASADTATSSFGVNASGAPVGSYSDTVSVTTSY